MGNRTGQVQGADDFKEYYNGGTDLVTWAGSNSADWIQIIGPGVTVVTTEAGAAAVPTYNRTITTDSNEPIAIVRGPFTALISTTAPRARMGVGQSPAAVPAATAVLVSAFAAAASITASATRTQAAATVLSKVVNRVDASTAVAAGSIAGDAVALMQSTLGAEVVVINNTVNPIQIFPVNGGTDQINSLGANVAAVIPPNDIAIFWCAAVGSWQFEAGYGFNGMLPTELSCDGITAAGSNQAGATALVAAYNTVSTVTLGQGVALMQSFTGLQITITNTSATQVIVYGVNAGTDTINGVAGSTGITIQAGSCATFTCTKTGAWNTSPVSPKAVAYNTASNTSSFTATAANISGGTADVDFALTGTLAAAGVLTLPTVASIVGALHAATQGTTYTLKIINQSAANFAWTVTTNTGWSLTGNMVVPAGTWTEFALTLTSLTAATLQYVNSGLVSAAQPPVRTGAAGAQTNATATLAALADLTMQVTAGQKVSGVIYLVAKNSTGAEGLQVDLNGGSATWTSIQVAWAGAPAGATVGVATSTALGPALTCTAVATTDAVFAVAFAGVVNAAGTLIPRFAEVSHTSGTATVEINSFAFLAPTFN